MRYSFLLLFIAVFCSCNGGIGNWSSKAADNKPNYKYSIKLAAGWQRMDTTINGRRTCFIFPPESLEADVPRMNIIVANMDGMDLYHFRNANIANMSLKDKYAIGERGDIKVGRIEGGWFTYLLTAENGRREMINYIIPVNGYAYMFTGGVSNGMMYKYRPAFDSIVQSLHF